MKKVHLVFCLLIVFTAGFGQDLSELKADTEKMYNASYNLDPNAIVEYTYPKLLTIISKEKMVDAMKNMFSNESMTITFNNPKTEFTYSDIKTIEKRKLAVIRYRMSMNMNLASSIDAEMGQAMADGVKSSGKYDLVSYDKKSNHILVEGPAVMVAVADDTTDNKWRFVNYDEKLFLRIFDENIKKELGL